MDVASATPAPAVPQLLTVADSNHPMRHRRPPEQNDLASRVPVQHVTDDQSTPGARVGGLGWGAQWQTAAMEAGLRVHKGGSGEPLLVLLHGLGATGDVWTGWWPLLARRWPGRWLAPDLPGHGGSPPLAAYTFDRFAAAVAGIVPPSARIVVLGHSLGGAVGLALASGRFAVPVQGVIGLGIKVVWADEDLGRAQAAARRPPAWFASRDDAAARYLRVSGLAGLLSASDPAWTPDCVNKMGDGGWPWIRVPSRSGRPIWRNCWHDRTPR